MRGVIRGIKNCFIGDRVTSQKDRIRILLVPDKDKEDIVNSYLLKSELCNIYVTEDHYIL